MTVCTILVIEALRSETFSTCNVRLLTKLHHENIQQSDMKYLIVFQYRKDTLYIDPVRNCSRYAYLTYGK